MKKHLLTLIISCIMLISSVAVSFSDEMYRKDIYRLNWYECDKQMSDASHDYLDELYVAVLSSFKCDLPVCVRNSDGLNISEYTKVFYDINKYGYGPNKYGIVLVYFTDTKECGIEGFGSPYEMTDFSSVRANFKQHINAGYGWYYVLSEYLNEMSIILSGLTKSDVENGESEEILWTKPDWYPRKVSEFKDFHNYTASRVVDRADIFTDEQERGMRAKIKNIQDKYGIDLVVVTDIRSYGMTHALYAADFHHFCGYGFGSDFTGSVLFICMEEGNRGWWTAATGSIEYIYQSSRVINWLDDRLEPYMKSGDYGQGVTSYIDDVESLYRLPDWYPNNPNNFVRRQNPYAPRIIIETEDIAIDEDKLADIEMRISKLAEEYNKDAVIFITNNMIHGSVYEYIDAYYRYKGYGLGATFDGIVLCITSSSKCSIMLYGEQTKRDKKMAKRIKDHVQKCITEKDYNKALDKYTRLTGIFFARGYIPKTVDWHLYLIYMCICGAIVGMIRVSLLKDKMKTIKRSVIAADYLNEGSFSLRYRNDKYVNTTVSKVYISSSGSGHSGGHRSSSGSYHSSGGRRYSGGGRSF